MGNSTHENLKMLISKMDNYVSTKTVVGDPVVAGDVTIIPLVDVSFGMATGVTATTEEESPKNKGKDGGAGGMGAKMTPSAVIVINNGSVQLVNVKPQEGGLKEKLIDMMPGLITQISALFKKNDAEEAEADEDELEGDDVPEIVVE